MQIQQGFLMWVGGGSDRYETMADYVAEVRERGASKRLPGIGMALALSEPGTVVYVAHDEGEAHSCDACYGKVECSACRTLQHSIDKWEAEADEVRKRYAMLSQKFGDDIPRGKARVIEIREARIAEARKQMEQCELCAGEGSYNCGTGGYVVLADRKRMDYRTYNYWMRQPEKFDTETVQKLCMCRECGGTGKRPDTVVFGAFVPRVEVVVDGTENEITRKHNKKLLERDRTARLTERKVDKETPRHGRDAFRHAGYYAVAHANGESKAAQSVANQLTAARAVKGGTEVIGDFVLFAKPVKVRGLKRFRGVKHFNLIQDASDKRAEMSA